MLKNWNLLLLAVFLISFPLAHCVDPPTEPRNLTKTGASSTTISLQWITPNNFRKIIVTSYLITYNGKEVETNSTSLDYTLTGLQPFTTYNISVAAMNAEGVGNNSKTITVETAEAGSSSPQNVMKSDVRSDQIHLSWTAPSDPKGVIKSYVIFYNEEKMNTRSPSSKYTLTRLQPFTVYNITVAAKNGAGLGKKSPKISVQTDEAGSSSPQNVINSTVRSDQIHLSWTAPSDPKGVITSYEITYNEGKVDTNSSATEYTLTGLQPFTVYNITVAARNGAGVGEQSPKITVKTDEAGSSSPQKVMKSVVRSYQIHLSWTAPSDPKGVITSYEITYNKGNVDTNSPAPEYILTGLQPFTVYNITVAARNGAGVGEQSPKITVKTDEAVPTQPTNLHSTSTNTTVTLEWSMPKQPNGIITSYVITYNGAEQVRVNTSDDSLSYTLTELLPFTTYTTSVSARNGAGIGNESQEAMETTKKGYPSAPVNLVVTRDTCNSAEFEWDAPEVIGDLRGTENYTVDVVEKSKRKDILSEVTASRSLVVKDLQAQTTYNVTVRAENSIGLGQLVMVTFNTQSYDPISLNIIPVSATGMTVKIVPPKDGANYSCTLSAHGQKQTALTSTTNATFSNLQPNTNYSVACLVYENKQELCYEGNGMGKTFPEVPDKPPANVKVLETKSTTFTAAWSVPADYERNEDIIGYNVVYWRAESQNKTNTTDNTMYTYTATGLTTDSVYYFTVAAITAKGTGVYSALSIIATIPIIDNLSIKKVTTDSLSLQWEGNYTGYTIHIVIEVVDEFRYGKTDFKPIKLSGDFKEFNVSDLHPFREYRIDLYLTNSDKTGNGLTVSETIRTEAKQPTVPPRGTGATTGARNVTLQWRIPRRSEINGIITSYRIEWESLANGTVQVQTSPITHNLTNPNFTHPEYVSYTLTSLTPHTNYQWRVAAVNEKGQGNFSKWDNFTTDEDAPGMVGTITYSSNNCSSVEAKWSIPSEPNGLIIAYELCYWELGKNCDSPSNTTNSTATEEFLNNLTPGVPHVVSVTAFTSAGRGADNTISMPFFSQELKPNTTVHNVTVNRINSTAANISWIPLTLHEARGYPEYTVKIISGGVTEFEKNTTESSILANDLEARKVYTAQVQPVTAGGQAGGPVSSVNFGSAPEGPNLIVIAIVIVLVILVTLICIILIVIIVVFCKYKKNKGELLYDNEEMVPLKELVDESMVAHQNMKKNNAIPKQQFSAHVRKMHLRKDSEFKEEFSDITREPPVGHEAAEANRTKNRYINIYPYDYSRVVLNKLDGSDYINAAFIDGYHGERRYIASQGPTPATVADFWEMIWEQQSTVIVMLTKLVEGTRVKCEQYWREDLNQPYEPGRDIRVTTTSHRVMTGFEARNITLEKTSEKSSPLKVKHFLYTAWPDHGVPQYSSSMVKFIQEQIRPEIQNSSSPIIVHCSAGAGRTGTLIAIDTAIDRLEEEEDINIFERVEFMRARRTQMVQNVNQYMYIHDAINDYVTCGNTTIVAHDLGKKIKVLNKTHPTTKMRGYDRQFQKLVDTSPEIDQTDLDFSQGADIAELNRYPDKIPYSDTEKHILTEDAEKYVNATEVKGYYGQNTFIAAQAPMKNTAEDIWNVIRERKCSVVVVLTNFRENEQEMCAEFWPSEVGVPMEIGYMKISLIQTDSSENFNKHNLSISVEEADILHKVEIYHYLSWVKDGCPNIPSLLKLMGEVQRSQQGDSEPVIVMCDDGMSRTGVFITVMSEIDRVKLEGEMDIFQTIKAARTARPYMVSTVKDFEYCHEIMQQYLESFDTYANFK